MAATGHGQSIETCGARIANRRAALHGTRIEELAGVLGTPFAIVLDCDCGNGVVDAGETCDIAIPQGNAGACPVGCNDGDNCTTDSLLDAGLCTARCESVPITDPMDDDGCCPEGATPFTDSDCAAIPTASGWGITIMTLALLAAAKTRYRRRL